jgi:hypothetical protein
LDGAGSRINGEWIGTGDSATATSAFFGFNEASCSLDASAWTGVDSAACIEENPFFNWKQASLSVNFDEEAVFWTTDRFAIFRAKVIILSTLCATLATTALTPVRE